MQVVGPSDIEQFTLQTNPRRTFTSSSQSGVSGSVNLFARRSNSEKEINPLSSFSERTFDDKDLTQELENIKRMTGSNIQSSLEGYLASVNNQTVSARKQKELEIIRFEPSTKFTSNTLRKNIIKDNLFPYYRKSYPSAQWAYTNYHCLNFFTSSDTPSDTVLLYPNSASTNLSDSASGSYTLGGPFTFEFYINPRYTTDTQSSNFHAGTIFHLSSSYVVSLMTGSAEDESNKKAGFRLALQLSHSADVAPSSINAANPSLGSGRRDLIFLSDDNSLQKNKWHRCAIRWGTDSYNHGTGSFVIDGQERGQFVIPSGSICPAPFLNQGNPDVLCIGNYYEGSNTGTNSQGLFFNQNISQREGLVELFNDGDPTTELPQNFQFAHPLNAEVHELKVHSRYMQLDELAAGLHEGSSNLDSVKFYLPPFFTKESPKRKTFGQNANNEPAGGILQTPFFAITGTTDDPFNVALSFGVGGHLLNLENFTRDLATGLYPRLLHLSASQIAGSTQEALSANDYLYATGSIRKRNVTVLPCDNGLFLPNFSVLVTGSQSKTYQSGTAYDKFVNDLGNVDYSLISLNNMISTSSIFTGIVAESGSIFDSIAGATPEDPGVQPGAMLTIFQRTRDPSSNEIVIFDISNMFYGNSIQPGTFSISDSFVTGSGGKVSITLKDDGMGNLYRADSRTPHASWASVGNILYNEGLVIIKTPNIPFFGKDQFEMSFSGEQNIHLMRIHSLAKGGEINSSSNPTYGYDWTLSPPRRKETVMSSSIAANDNDSFVYITGLNFHDENLNVILKSKFAQPIIKKSSDKILFRTKMDF